MLHISTRIDLESYDMLAAAIHNYDEGVAGALGGQVHEFAFAKALQYEQGTIEQALLNLGVYLETNIIKMAGQTEDANPLH